MDTLTPERRSYVMSRIRSENTKPERIVRSWLHRAGFRFRIHVKTLPGHPDIVLPKYRTVLEVRGCFWHRHAHCAMASTPKSNVAFWKAKFARNVARDAKHEEEWLALGWNVLIVWECELAPAKREETFAFIRAFLDSLLADADEDAGTAAYAAEADAEYDAKK